jgi:hypothetical protein
VPWGHRRPSSSCGLIYIPTKTNNAEKATSRAHMWAHMGPFQGLGGGTAAIRRSDVESDHLPAYKVAFTGQEMDVD